MYEKLGICLHFFKCLASLDLVEEIKLKIILILNCTIIISLLVSVQDI